MSTERCPKCDRENCGLNGKQPGDYVLPGANRDCLAHHVDWRARARAAEARAADLQRERDEWERLAELRGEEIAHVREECGLEMMRATREAAGRDALGAIVRDRIAFLMHGCWECGKYDDEHADYCCVGKALAALAEDRK